MKVCCGLLWHINLFLCLFTFNLISQYLFWKLSWRFIFSLSLLCGTEFSLRLFVSAYLFFSCFFNHVELVLYPSSWVGFPWARKSHHCSHFRANWIYNNFAVETWLCSKTSSNYKFLHTLKFVNRETSILLSLLYLCTL